MPEIVVVDDDQEKVSCDGGRTFGHPRVYLTLGDDGVVECYYCGRRFERRSMQSEATRDDAA